MQRVVSINLNGNAYQLDENAYNALFAYLDGAEARLKDTPDRAAIIADMERAIAEKCGTYLSPHKTVVTAAEIDRIIAEMGPVAGPPADASRDPGAQSATGSGTGEKARTGSHAHKRLYQIHEGAMISGVCMGLATFLHIDVTLIRILFVVFAVTTSGWGILAYAVGMFILPHATTREQAAAMTESPQSWPWDQGWPWDRHGWPWDRHGWPWDRHDSPRDRHDAPRDRHDSPRDQDQRREWQPQPPAARWEHGPSPVFGTLIIASCVVLGFLWLSFWTRGRLSVGWPYWGWPFFWGFPNWFGILLFFMLFRFLFMPFRMSRWGWYGHPRYGYGPYAHPHYAWLSMWHGMVWFAMMIALAWFAYHYIPEVHDFIQRIQTEWSDGRFRV